MEKKRKHEENTAIEEPAKKKRKHKTDPEENAPNSAENAASNSIAKSLENLQQKNSEQKKSVAKKKDVLGFIGANLLSLAGYGQ